MPTIVQCSFCKHYNMPERAVEKVTCLAFPEGIPDEIIENDYDHREPYQGDNGIQFEECDAEMIQTRFADWSTSVFDYQKERTLFFMSIANPHRSRL